MNTILIAGCGDIAMRVAQLLRGRYRLLGLARHRERFAQLRAAGITPIHGDLDDALSLHRIAGLADVVLHFAPPAGANIFSPATRVAPGASEATVDLRTRHLLAALSRRKLPGRLIYISTTGVYGDCGGATVSETRPLNPQTARAMRRVDAERQIRAWAARLAVNANVLRVPGIYAANRLPLKRLRHNAPAIEASEDSYTNHIHADDLARIVVASLRYGRPNRTYNACDDSAMKMGDYFDACADFYGLPRPPRLARAEIARTASPALWSFMNESRRVMNTRMKKELKVALRYAAVADGIAAIVRGEDPGGGRI